MISIRKSFQISLMQNLRPTLMFVSHNDIILLKP